MHVVTSKAIIKPRHLLAGNRSQLPSHQGAVSPSSRDPPAAPGLQHGARCLSGSPQVGSNKIFLLPPPPPPPQPGAEPWPWVAVAGPLRAMNFSLGPWLRPHPVPPVPSAPPRAEPLLHEPHSCSPAPMAGPTDPIAGPTAP